MLRHLVLFSAWILTTVSAQEDISVYIDNALASGWENWSWGTTIDFAATDLFEGTSSASVSSDAWSALSVKYQGVFTTYAGLKFDIAGDAPDLSITITATSDDTSSTSVALSAFGANITSTAFTTLLMDFSALPGTGAPLGNGTWDRMTFQGGANGAVYHIDNIVLVESINVAPEFLSAEPIGSNIIALTTKGEVDMSTVNVTLKGSVVKISNQTTYVPVGTPSKSITYLTLASSFSAGALVINAGDKTFSYTLPAVQYASIVTGVNYTINPDIYGVNWPTSASYIKNLGVGISRWGGNAVTAYNPNGHFTNAGSDWYFENRGSDSADDWLGWVSGAGSSTHLTIPALDWVSKDASSYSFPKTVYPDQQSFDPYKPDAGNGMLPNGSFVSPPPDPANAYTPWNTTLAKAWLSGLANKPDIVTIDNEIEIAANTHVDMHPEIIGYDEELDRVVRFGVAAKEALPNVKVAAPSTCSWWFYWTSAIGYTDNAAHDNIDFIPWFLAQMKKKDTALGKRILDYLDIHYYFLPDLSANDDAAKALRLRMTRSLWDTTYVDESWAASNPQNHQWDPTVISLIPRMHTLIAQNYPGTKLSISEWSSTKDEDITGGLVTVDALGIFGKYKLDSATYWTTPNEVGPVGLAYWLYRGYGTYFGSSSAQVNMATPLPNTQSIFAGIEAGKLSLVIVNKNPDKPLSFDLANVPTGSYFMRHFGGGAGVAKWQTTTKITNSAFIVVPAYTAVFLKQT